MKMNILPFLSALSMGLALPSDAPSRRFDQNIGIDLPALFSETTTAKIWRTAVNSISQVCLSFLFNIICWGTYALHKLPGKFPNYVPSTGSNIGQYVFSDISAWTSGFFPGSLYELLERSVRFPDHLKTGSVDPQDIHNQVLDLSRQWAKPLQTQAFRTNTHDLGFLIMPAFQKVWELTGNKDSLDTIVTAAHSLATRFDPRVKAVRSWDSLVNKRQNITNQETNFLVIIDSM